MNRLQRRSVMLVGLIGLVVVALGMGITVIHRNQTSPDAVVLRYIEALDRHDVSAANALLSSDAHPWAQDTPAEQLGGHCLDARVHNVSLSPEYAAVKLACTGNPNPPGYFLIKEDGVWKVRKLH